MTFTRRDRSTQASSSLSDEETSDATSQNNRAMDSDEFDDDIADEDLIAASQIPAPSRGQVAKINQGRFQPHVNSPRPNSLV